MTEFGFPPKFPVSGEKEEAKQVTQKWLRYYGCFGLIGWEVCLYESMSTPVIFVVGMLHCIRDRTIKLSGGGCKMGVWGWQSVKLYAKRGQWEEVVISNYISTTI